MRYGWDRKTNINLKVNCFGCLHQIYQEKILLLTNDYFGVGFERIACWEIHSRLMEWVDKWEKVAKGKEVTQQETRTK